MPASRVCNGCKRRFTPETKSQARCPACRLEHNREAWAVRMSDPLERELRNFRRSRRWQVAQRRCFLRDGYRCRGVVRGVECGATTDLQAHHMTLARDLIADGRDPCDLRYLATLCRSCHAKADAQLRARPLPPL